MIAPPDSPDYAQAPETDVCCEWSGARRVPALSDEDIRYYGQVRRIRRVGRTGRVAKETEPALKIGFIRRSQSGEWTTGDGSSRPPMVEDETGRFGQPCVWLPFAAEWQLLSPTRTRTRTRTRQVSAFQWFPACEGREYQQCLHPKPPRIHFGELAIKTSVHSRSLSQYYSPSPYRLFPRALIPSARPLLN